DLTVTGVQTCALPISWNSAGTYTVSMRVANSEGADSATAVVRVVPSLPAPIASFSFAPVSPDTGTAVQFTDTSTGGPPVEWHWRSEERRVGKEWRRRG